MQGRQLGSSGIAWTVVIGMDDDHDRRQVCAATTCAGRGRTLDEGEWPAPEVDDLFLNDDTQGSKHSHTSVCNLRLSPPPDIPDGVVAGSSAAQEVQWVKNVGEWLGNSGQGPGVCKGKKISAILPTSATDLFANARR